MIKSAGGFGGGIAGTGNVCGILLGAVAMISTVYSRGNLEEKEDPRLWSLSSQFTGKFAELTKPFGGMNCGDIARVDWRNKEEVKDYYANPHSRRRICIEILGDAACFLGELLDQEKARG